MTATATSAFRRRGLVSPSRVQFVRYPVAVGVALLAACFALSTLVDLTDGGDVAAWFAVAAVLCGGYGWWELQRVARPAVTTAPAVMTMTTLVFVTIALGSTVAHLLADATDELDTAILEGTAPITTTAMTGLDLDQMPRGLLMLRALLQWVGGFGALLVGLVVVPLVVGGKELRSRGLSDTGQRALIRGHSRGLRDLAAVYGSISAALAVAYLAAGLGVFDAVAHAMATVSTGGLSTRTGSLAAFGEPAVEWVATVGMGAAGVNLGVLWWIVQRDHRAIRRNTELRVYLVVMAMAIVALAAWLGDDVDAPVRTAALSVTSAMSTTGFTTTPWWTFEAGPETVMLILVGIGAMSGSAGGGFRYLRVLQALGFARRELERQLHRSAVAVVRVNTHTVPERTLERTAGYIVLFVTVVAAGGMLIELGDSAITPSAAITLSVSALSTTGTQVIDPVDLSTVGTITKLTLSALMLLGRLSMYIVVFAVINLVGRVASRVEDHLHRGSA